MAAHKWALPGRLHGPVGRSVLWDVRGAGESARLDPRATAAEGLGAGLKGLTLSCGPGIPLVFKHDQKRSPLPNNEEGS